MKNTGKKRRYFLFNKYEESARFACLYEGCNFYSRDYNNLCIRRFGEDVEGKWFVIKMLTNSEMAQIKKDLKLKKKRYNGNWLYVFA